MRKADSIKRVGLSLVFSGYFFCHILCSLPQNQLSAAFPLVVENFEYLFQCKWNFFAKPPLWDYRLYYNFQGGDVFEVLFPLAGSRHGDCVLRSILISHLNHLEIELENEFGNSIESEQLDLFNDGKIAEYLEARFSSSDCSWSKFLRMYSGVLGKAQGLQDSTNCSVVISKVLIRPSNSSMERVEVKLFESDLFAIPTQ